MATSTRAGGSTADDYVCPREVSMVGSNGDERPLSTASAVRRPGVEYICGFRDIFHQGHSPHFSLHWRGKTMDALSGHTGIQTLEDLFRKACATEGVALFRPQTHAFLPAVPKISRDMP